MKKSSVSYNSVLGPSEEEEGLLQTRTSANGADVASAVAKRGLVYLPKDTLSYAAKYLFPHDLASLGRVCRLLKLDVESTSDYILQAIDPVYVEKRRSPCVEHDEDKQEAGMESRHLLTYLYELTCPRVLLIGGGSLAEGPDSYLRVDELSLNSETWTNKANMAMARGTFRTDALQWNNDIVVVSGETAASVGTLAKYSIAKDEWTELPPLPQRIKFASATCNNNSLFVTSGTLSGNGYSSAVYRLDMGAVDWVCEEATLPLARFGHGTCITTSSTSKINSDNQTVMMICGGQLVVPAPVPATPDDPQLEPVLAPTSSTLVWGMKNGAGSERGCGWLPGPEMRRRRIWMHMLCLRGVTYAVGGDVTETGSNLLPSIERLNASTNTWEMVAEFKAHRRVFSVTSNGDDGKIYVLGGRGASYEAMLDVEVFDTVTGVWKDDAAAITIPRTSFIGGCAVFCRGAELKW